MEQKSDKIQMPQHMNDPYDKQRKRQTEKRERESSSDAPHNSQIG